MPIKECKLDGKDGFKWGDKGKCYTHNNTPKTKKEARRKALIQGIATGEIFSKKENEK